MALPIKKKSKRKPHRETYCVCHIADDKIFMVQRDDQSIWPRLWTPLLQDEINKTVSAPEADRCFIKPFKHVFTHFTLTIKPILTRQRVPESQRGRWFTKEEALASAIPAAIRKIINNLTIED